MSLTTYVALLRGINVGGRKPVGMADLRGLLGAIGCSDARSLLQSGNLVFRRARRDARGLERVLEREAAASLSLETSMLVRTADEWRDVVSGNPFSKEARTNPGLLVVVFLKEPVDAGRVQHLRNAVKGRESVRGSGRHLYIVYPDGMGRSKLTHALIERTLGTKGTARNWNTTLKLASAVEGLGAKVC